MLRLSLFTFLVFLSSSYAATDVLVAKNVIHYKAKIEVKDLMLQKVDSVKSTCTPLKLSDIDGKVFQALHYISKGSIICTKDVSIFEKKSVVFNFGSIEIEKNGEIIFQNEEYIRIKRNDGKIEKIYKDGRIE
ncbi:hypothetical protein CRU99_09965 [Malaciobacter mytili]|uniref:hypothetical protein n=1 Tax=Malaciobacter mytili TaxID=603050 RepID=UPI00100C2F1A|nr:hypothetical protein [Malaciobacter mytili]RXI41165.1 hypothetical protein CRU99_09965 [Malaciobacter mytili]